MYYTDGQEVRLGDKVRLAIKDSGVVVCSMDTNEYSNFYTKDNWSYLKNGVMILFDNGGLMHYQDTEELLLVSRK